MMTQRLAGNQLHRDVMQAAIAGRLVADVIDRDEMRMIQPGGRPRLALESLQRFRVRGDVVRKNLDRDVAPEARVARAIDLGHPPAAEQSSDFVRPEPSPARQCHGKRPAPLYASVQK